MAVCSSTSSSSTLSSFFVLRSRQINRLKMMKNRSSFRLRFPFGFDSRVVSSRQDFYSIFSQILLSRFCQFPLVTSRMIYNRSAIIGFSFCLQIDNDLIVNRLLFRNWICGSELLSRIGQESYKRPFSFFSSLVFFFSKFDFNSFIRPRANVQPIINGKFRVFSFYCSRDIVIVLYTFFNVRTSVVIRDFSLYRYLTHILFYFYNFLFLISVNEMAV